MTYLLSIAFFACGVACGVLLSRRRLGARGVDAARAVATLTQELSMERERVAVLHQLCDAVARRELVEVREQATRIAHLAEAPAEVSLVSSSASGVERTSARASAQQLVRHARAASLGAERLVRDATVLCDGLAAAAVSRGSDPVAEVRAHVQRLIAGLEQLLGSADGVRSEIAENKNRFQETSSLASTARVEAERGYRAVHETLEEFEATRKLSVAAQERMIELTRRIASIDDVVHAITGIAQRTRLLALNASIIAAQSGEHAAGFAVLADEIKALAQRTAASSEDIVGQIRSVQGETARASEAMTASVSAIERGLKVAFQAGDALGAIRESNRQAQRRIVSIARSVDDGLARAEKVVDASRGLTAQGARLHRELERAPEADPLAALRKLVSELTSTVKERGQGVNIELQPVIELADRVATELDDARAVAAGPQEATRVLTEAVHDVGRVAADMLARLRRTEELATTTLSGLGRPS